MAKQTPQAPTTMEEAHHRIEQRNAPPTTNAAPPLQMPPARRFRRLDANGRLTANAIEERLFEGMFLRTAFYSRLLDGKKDINYECGYPPVIMIQQYRELYDREGIAKRVVNVWPEESWSLNPDIFEDEDPTTDTDFELSWREVNKKFDLWHWCERVDDLSGIGQYGILLLGIDDGRDLSEPADGIDDHGEKVGAEKHQLLFIRAFDESATRVKYREMDPTNPRFGLPTMYTVLFIDMGITGIAQGTDIISKDIHWSRVLHVADNRKMSEVYGVPRMQPVYNRLIDLRKILSSSGEMFWKGGFPGISFEVNPDLVDQGATMDPESIRKEFEKYQDGLQRYIATTGVTAKSLQIQVSDPTAHTQVQLDAIALTLGIPKRVFFGTEEAQLAGAQDADAWNKRVGRRQNRYLSPMIIRPLVDRLVCFGVLAEPGKKCYTLEWPDLDSPTDSDKAAIALQKTQALAAYVGGGVDQMIPPKEYLTLILGMSDKEAELVDIEAEAYASDHPHPSPEEQPGAKATAFTQPGSPKAPAPPMIGPNGKPMVGPDGKPIPGTAKPNPFAKGQPAGKPFPPKKGKPKLTSNEDPDDDDDPEDGGNIKPSTAAKPGTSTTPGSYPGGLGQPMPPYSIPPGAGVGGGTPAVPISGQRQRGRVQGTKGKGGPSAVNPQGKPGKPQTQVKGKPTRNGKGARPFEVTDNFNPNHDEHGRFSDSDAGPSGPNTTKDHLIKMADMRGSNASRLRSGSYHDFVLKNGQHFAAGPRPAGVRQGTMKQCYKNAYELASSDPKKYIYAEGYAQTKTLPGLPFSHAWVVDRATGKVIDPTWKDGQDYRGVPLDLAYVQKTIIAKGTYGVLDNYQQGNPLLRGDTDFKDKGFKGFIKPMAQDSQQTFKNTDGTWVPKRAQLHARLINDMGKDATPVAAPTAHLMGGGPGSGKSWAVKHGDVPIMTNAYKIDPDAVKMTLPEYAKGVKKGDVEVGSYLHEESSEVAKAAIRHGLGKGCNVEVDGTSDGGVDKALKRIRGLREMGAKRVTADYIDCKTDTAWERALDRGARTGRYTPEAYLRGTHKDVANVFHGIVKANACDELRLWNTDSNEPKLVFSQIDGKKTVHDRALWEAFKAKRNEDPTPKSDADNKKRAFKY